MYHQTVVDLYKGDSDHFCVNVCGKVGMWEWKPSRRVFLCDFLDMLQLAHLNILPT